MWEVPAHYLEQGKCLASRHDRHYYCLIVVPQGTRWLQSGATLEVNHHLSACAHPTLWPMAMPQGRPVSEGLSHGLKGCQMSGFPFLGWTLRWITMKWNIRHQEIEAREGVPLAHRSCQSHAGASLQPPR